MCRRKKNKRNLSKDELRKSGESKIITKVPNISYGTLFRFASRRDKLMIAVALLSTIVAGCVVPYALTVIGTIFQTMINYAKAKSVSESQDKKFLHDMYTFGVTYCTFGCIYFICGYIGTSLLNITAINQVFKIREAYLKAALNQDFEYLDIRQTGDFASKMADDMLHLEEGIGDKLAAAVYNVTVAVGCILMALLRGWKLALICLASTPITFLLVGLTSRLAQRLSKQEAEASGKASAVAEEVISSIRTVYAFNGQEKELERYQVHLREARKIEIKKAKVYFSEVFTGLSMGFMYLCVFSSYALAFYMGTYLIVHDPKNYDAGTMYEVFFGVVIGMSTLGMLAGLVSSLSTARGAGASIFFLLDNKPTINPLNDRGLKPETISGNIDLKNVVFRYPSRPEIMVLKGVDISVTRGQSAALVGHSGCGKSTIVQLVSRYYDALEGVVSIDGRDVRELSVVWLRAQIGLVGQEPVLFNTSVRENIRYGREAASDADIEAAARQANAHQFIVKLPMGYETQVGESGASLSGGQKQRIAIARALVRNPAILLLDEATSALDMRSEAKVQVALNKASQGRTTLIVAHRLATIRHVDVIYVMKSGVVVEKGSHEELVALKGHYYEMLNLQEPNLSEEPSASAVSNVESVISKRSANEEEEEEVIDASATDWSKTPPLSFCRVVRLNAPEWKPITVGAVCAVVIGAAMPMFVLVYGNLYGSMSDPNPDHLMKQVVTSGITFVVIGVVMGLSTLIESLSFGVAGAKLTERLRARMFGHLLRLSAAFYDDRAHSTGALCARLSAEAAYVRNATGQRIGVMLQGVSSVGLALALALYVEWRVALVAMIFFPLLGIVVYYQGKVTTRESFGNARMLENSTKVAVEAVSNVRTVQSLGRQHLFLRDYVAQLRPALGPAKKSAHCRGVVTGLSRSMFTFINSAAVTYGGYLMVHDDIPYENVLIATQALQMVSGQVQNAFTYAPDFQKGISAASRAVALLDTKPLIADPEYPTLTDFHTQATGAARFDSVEFRYPSRPGDRVLRGLDLEIEQGKTIALVGQSGGGKSTVVSLLQRYYDPEHGIVSLDGVPLPRIRLNEVRSCYGLVSQEPVLFDRTLAENIAYGDNSRAVPREEIVAAARLANIHEFVDTLPEGYNSNIGAKGVQLSGGQKQRIAIARALVRRPKILLLDEATSALDTESEKVVQEALDRAKAGRTCVTIAHRLSTVRDADTICVLSSGRVAEQGNHHDLMAKKGLYYKLHAGKS